MICCVACSADVPEEDLFCENCGVRLPRAEGVEEACVCGAPVREADEEGFCGQCGRRVRRPASDHIEVVVSAEFAGVSDRGLRHEKNEDRFAVMAEAGGAALVVCDGVSATEHPEVASEAVATVVAGVLATALRGGEVGDAAELMAEAMAKAAEELQLRHAGGTDAGMQAASTTAVSAVVMGREITVGWVGDSRAYWIDQGGARLLTRDHSWMNMALELGHMTREEIEAAPQAHAITRWLGADAEGAAAPEIVRHLIEGEGTLLLCTDGLWNYVSSPEQMVELVRGASEGRQEAIAVARALVAFAIEQGGRDNVTVALLRVAAPEEQAGKAAAAE